MEHTKELLSIDLSNLVKSPDNVRKHTVTDVEELAALIAAQGLLHPLIVTEQVTGKGKAGKLRFAVAAGERRRRALLLLQQRGQLPKAHEVLCELVPPERAREVSVAENSGREPLHPADAFDAFKAMVDEGKGIEDVAARFGVSVLTVQRRLKLAVLSPKLLALYREDGLNLDQLMALAISDDHAAQENAWFDAPQWERTPVVIKRKLTAGEVETAGNALVRFVGIEAYEAAGGIVRRDLFDDDQSRYIAAPDLLSRLAGDKLEALAATVRDEGWAWAEPRIELDSQALRQFTPCEHTVRKPNELERADLAELLRRSTELQRQSKAMHSAAEWSADEAECINLEEQDIEVRRRAIHEGLKVWPAEVRARAGVIVAVSREGDAQIIRGLLREADRKALVALQRATSRRQAKADVVTGDPGEPAPSNEDHAPECSESLLRRLAAHRTAAMQAMLSANTKVAVAALAHVLIQRAFGDDYNPNRPALQIVLQASSHALSAVADDLKASRACQAIEASKASWRERLPEQRNEWFGWLIDLPQDELLDLLALCTSLTLNALPSVGAAYEANKIAEAVGLDMADWWEPTAEGYLNHVSKAQIAQALKEAGPELIEEGMGAMKKDVLVVKAASRLAGKRWLPVSLRRPER
jgi:ParB family transcriptional regulator, chromosome partitioning protein